LQRDHGINPKRVFATGHSNGGHYAFRLALEQPEEVAGIAAISASLPTADNTVCQAAGKEIPVMIINGTSDPMNPYEGGKVAMWGLLASRGTVTSSEASAAYFAGLGGALAAPQVERLPQVDPSDASWVERKTWRSARGIEVVLLSVHGGGHVVPQPYCRYPRLMGHQTRNLDAPLEICRFFGVL
jgi:polyhydroxybutyrate depolymerase